MKVAQQLYIELYNIDITSIVSMSSLSLKIFRLNFLKHDIPILSQNIDNYIRNSYFGGAVDIYKCYAENVYYYDVNSLYPWAMCQPMPLELIETILSPNLDKFNLDNFFGFIELELICPDSVNRPVLPFKAKGRTIFPKGKLYWSLFF